MVSAPVWGTGGPEFESRRPTRNRLVGLTRVPIRAKTMTEDKQSGFIAGGPRRVRGEDEGFWAFLRAWVVNLFKVDRRL